MEGLSFSLNANVTQQSAMCPLLSPVQSKSQLREFSLTVSGQEQPDISITVNSDVITETNKNEKSISNDSSVQIKRNTDLDYNEIENHYCSSSLNTSGTADSTFNSPLSKNSIFMGKKHYVSNASEVDNLKMTKNSLCTTLSSFPKISTGSSKVLPYSNKPIPSVVNANLIKSQVSFNKISFNSKLSVVSTSIHKSLPTLIASKNICVSLPPLKATAVVKTPSCSITTSINFASTDKSSGKKQPSSLNTIPKTAPTILINKNNEGKGTTATFPDHKKVIYGRLSVISSANSDGINKKKLFFLSDQNIPKKIALNSQNLLRNSLTTKNICKTSPAPQGSPIMVPTLLSQNLPNLQLIECDKNYPKNNSNSNKLKLPDGRLSSMNSTPSTSIESSLSIVKQSNNGNEIVVSTVNSGILRTFILNVPSSKLPKFGVHTSPAFFKIQSPKISNANDKSNPTFVTSSKTPDSLNKLKVSTSTFSTTKNSIVTNLPILLEKSSKSAGSKPNKNNMVLFSNTIASGNNDFETFPIIANYRSLATEQQKAVVGINKTQALSKQDEYSIVENVVQSSGLYKKEEITCPCTSTSMKISAITVNSLQTEVLNGNIDIVKKNCSENCSTSDEIICSMSNQSDHLFVACTSSSVTPSSSSTQKNVLFRKRKSTQDSKDFPTSLSKISRTFFALDRLYRCRSQWINDGNKYISYLRELRDVLIVERAQQKKFLDTMMQMNIERLKKKSTQKLDKKINQTPAEKLIDKLSLKVNDAIDVNKIARPSLKRKTFLDIKKEQEKRKQVSKTTLDKKIFCTPKKFDKILSLTNENDSQQQLTCKRKNTNDPLTFKKCKLTKVVSDQCLTQTNKYAEEIKNNEEIALKFSEKIAFNLTENDRLHVICNEEMASALESDIKESEVDSENVSMDHMGNSRKQNPLVLRLNIKSSREIHEKLKEVKQKTSVRTRSYRPNPKDPFISTEYGALQQAIALSLKSEQNNDADVKSKETIFSKTGLNKKVANKKRSREVEQLTDAHWNESWLRGSCSPTYASPRLGREERSLHWALSKFAEMDNEEFDNQTFVQSEKIISSEKTNSSKNLNSFKSESNEHLIESQISSPSKKSISKKENSKFESNGTILPDEDKIVASSANHSSDVKNPSIRLKKLSDVEISLRKKDFRKKQGLAAKSQVHLEKRNGDFRNIQNLAEKRMSCTVNRSTGETILHKAARLGYCDIVEESIRAGIDVNVRDNAGWSPLHEACAYSHVDVAKILLKYGADSNSSSKNGMRPIYDALEKQDFPMIRLLLSYGADVASLKYASCKSEVLKFMTAHQIDREKDLNSALHKNDEGPWQFAGTCPLLDVNECAGIFDDIPIEERSLNMEFEVTSRPMPLSFYLPYRNESGDILGYRNYFILSEFLSEVNLSISVFLKHNAKDIIKMTTAELVDSAQRYSITKPIDVRRLSCDNNGFIELVYISPHRLRKLLKQKIVKIPAMIF